MSTPTRTLDRLTASFESIELERLVSRAGLLARTDRKYLLPTSALPELFARIDQSTRVLEMDHQRSFRYRSRYFDTPDRDSFYTSGRSRRGRWKVRTRTYENDGSTWLEVKRRGPRGTTNKRRIRHPESDRLSAAGVEFVSESVSPEVAGQLAPVLETAYTRTTLFLPAEESRVTIDFDLYWVDAAFGETVNLPDAVIIEAKTGSTPTSVDRHLWRLGHRPVRISKFGVGMAVLDPQLSRLKWHRVIENNFTNPHAQASRKGIAA